ncbi:hypothetical protein C1H46_019002 [Malus baccata]|uniref:Carbohydrate kinase PfkB domain-containing protein n=1 Tax=Malus baccata TaxID=106549 RepID=A0A540M9D3_MALBA|nr:hypothetical protein C1H46_019002 [Malus baccata]
MCSGYENPYENSLKFDHGGGSGGSYLDDRYGGYNRSRSDLGSDPYGKWYDAGPDTGRATVFMLTEVIILFLQWLIISLQLWTKKLVLHEDSKDASSHKKGGSQDDKSLVVCFGEMLIDFVPTVGGVSLAEALAFKKAHSVAPANVAVGVARLGGSAGFIGKKTDSSTTFAFCSRSSVDIEPMRIRLQSNSYTTNTFLDTVTAATIQVPDEAVTKCTACG